VDWLGSREDAYYRRVGHAGGNFTARGQSIKVQHAYAANDSPDRTARAHGVRKRHPYRLVGGGYTYVLKALAIKYTEQAPSK
jgi:hypothetical protein